MLDALRSVDAALDTHAAVAQLARGRGRYPPRIDPVPEGETCFCLFAADSTSVVELVDRRLLVPSVRVGGALIADPPVPTHD